MLALKHFQELSILLVLSVASIEALQQQQVAENQVQEAAASKTEQHPAPEPYSFSYSAESIGGQSTHQESGDGTGRVTGFYTIAGEDGRERRVDYVADENGYRATISTNEVGTRSESSADAQYSARLPSEKQLEQAKVTLEQYKYLEETHANEREQQLARLASPSRNFQAQQQHQQSAWSTANQQQQGYSERQQQQALGRQQQQQQQQQNQLNSNSFVGQQERFSTNTRQQQVVGANNQISTSAQSSEQQFGAFSSNQEQTAVLSTVRPPVNLIGAGDYVSADDADWRSRASAKLTGLPAGVSSATSSSSSGTWSRQQNQTPRHVESQQSEQLSNADANQNIAVQQASQQTSEVGVQRAQGANVNQQQQQRLDETQQVQAAAWQLANRGGAPARKLNTVLQRQLEQQFMQQAQQLTEQDYARRQPAQFNNQFGGQILRGQQQTFVQPQLQQQTAQFVTGQLQQNTDFQNSQQQQSNIIDESVDVNDQAVVADQNEQTKNNDQQVIVQQPKQQQVITTTSQQPLVTTTTIQPTVPSGFVSIDLAGEKKEQQVVVANQEQQQQEIEQRPRVEQVVVTTRPTPQFGYDQFISQSGGQTKQQQQRVEEVSEQPQLQEIPSRPNSIKQIIEQQKGYSQQQQTVGKVSPPRTTTILVPTTTTTTTQAPVVVEPTTRAPVYVEPVVTTTLAPARKQTPQVYIQPATTTAAPVEVVYATGKQTTTAAVLDTRPVQQQQQQQEYGAVKGGYARKQSSAFNRVSTRPTSDYTMTNINENFVPVRTSSFSKQTTISTTSRPTTISVAQVKQQTFVAEQQPVQVAKQQQVDSGYSWQQQQPIITTTTQQPPLKAVQPERQQYANLGTKGGSSKGNSKRQQFWQQQASRVAQLNQSNSPTFRTNIEPANPYFGTRMVASSARQTNIGGTANVRYSSASSATSSENN